MRFGRHRVTPSEGAYNNGYPLLTLQDLSRRGLVRSYTAFDDIGVPQSRRKGTSADEGWARREPSEKTDAQTAAQSAEPSQPDELLDKGYMHAGTRVVPSPLPDTSEQVGGVTVIRQGGYATPEAAIFAEAADRYYQMLKGRYGAENVMTHTDDSPVVREGELLGRRIAYYVRLDTHVPQAPPEEHDL